MRLIVENRFALFGLVALALAALFGVAFVIRPVTAELGVSEPGTVRPDRAARVCPAPHESADDGAESSLAAFAPRVSRDDEGELWAQSVPAAPDEDEDGDDSDADDDNDDDNDDNDDDENDNDDNGDDSDADGEDDGSDEEDGQDGAESAQEREPVGDELTEPNRVWQVDTSEVTVPTGIHAEGDLASGLDAGQFTVSDDNVTEVQCAASSIGTWFALPGGSDPEGVELDSLTAHLSNPEDFRATVSIDIYTADGPSFSTESRGISLLEGESTELELTELIQNTGAIGVHVRTSTGRVAASLLAEHASGGVDWVPPTSAPAEEHVLPGVPGGDGSRRLLLAAPGDEPVEVRAHVVTTPADEEERAEDAEDDDNGEGEDSGSGTADDPMTVHVPPAASAWLTLEGALGGERGTVVLEADGPVAAGVVAEIDGGDETAHTAAVEPLSSPLNTVAVLPDAPGEAESELVLGAPEEDATLMVTPVGEDGDQGDAVRVEVPAGHTHAVGPDTDNEGWEPPAGVDEDDGYAVRLDLLEEGSGPVYAARVLRTDDGLSVLPVTPAPVEVQLPVVRDSMVGVVP